MEEESQRSVLEKTAGRHDSDTGQGLFAIYQPNLSAYYGG
jgi:hypothetical protein